MSGGATSIRRILVGVDASPLSLLALEEALDLAAHLGAEVEALCVEDVNLTRLSSHPQALAYCVSTARHLPLDDSLLERAVRVQVRQAVRLVESSAESRGVQIKIRCSHGQVAEEVMAAAQGADLVVLGWMARPARRLRAKGPRLGSTAGRVAVGAGPSVYLLQARREPQDAVLAVDDGSAGALSALQTAAHLANASGVGVVTVLRLPGMRDTAKADKVLHDAHCIGHVQPITATTPDGLRQAVAHLTAGVLVLSVELEMLKNARLRDALDELPCSVLLVR